MEEHFVFKVKLLVVFCSFFFLQKWLALKVSNKMGKKLQSVRAAAMTALIEALPGQCTEVGGSRAKAVSFLR